MGKSRSATWRHRLTSPKNDVGPHRWRHRFGQNRCRPMCWGRCSTSEPMSVRRKPMIQRWSSISEPTSVRRKPMSADVSGVLSHIGTDIGFGRTDVGTDVGSMPWTFSDMGGDIGRCRPNVATSLNHRHSRLSPLQRREHLPFDLPV